MSEALIRAQIKSTLEAVSGIGAVHDYRRFKRSIADLLSVMTDADGKINGWTIHRRSTPQAVATLGRMTWDRVHTYEIMGIYGMDDEGASEIDFQALCDAVLAAFDGSDNLGGTCRHADPINLDDCGEWDVSDLGGDVYHAAQFTLTVYERVT